MRINERVILKQMSISGSRWIAITALVACLSAGCSKGGASDESDATKEGATVAQVTLTEVTRADISRVLQLNGSIAAVPNLDVKVSSFVPGRIAELKVAEGDRVSAGQLIAQIDDRSYRDQLTQAEAGKAQAEANVESAKLNLARNEDLVQRGIAARKDLEDARTESSVTAAALKQAVAALSIAQLQLTRTEIHSPIAGTVVKRFVSGGEQVDGTAATPIVEVASLGEVELQANIPAADLSRLPIGRALRLTSTAFPGKNFSGRVVAVSQAVDPTTNAGMVRIHIPNGNGELRLGMFLGAQVPVETHLKALGVPTQAIYRDDQGAARVFIVQGDQATAATVKLGIETPDRAELLEGVKEGDKVILSGGYGLGDKAKVSVEAADKEGKKDAKPDDKKDDKDDKKDDK